MDIEEEKYLNFSYIPEWKNPKMKILVQSRPINPTNNNSRFTAEKQKTSAMLELFISLPSVLTDPANHLNPNAKFLENYPRLHKR